MPRETPDSRNSLVCIGKISGAHGIRGAVKIHTYTEQPESIAKYSPLTDETGKRQLTITRIDHTKNATAVVQMEGIRYRDEAEKLRGIELYVPRTALPEPDDDEFYIDDLIGMQAVSPDMEIIGTILTIQNYGAGDMMEIQPTHGRPAIDPLPFTHACVPEINFDNGTVTVVLPNTEYVRPDQKGKGHD